MSTRSLIVGMGIVGTATARALEERKHHQIEFHDPPKGIIGNPMAADFVLVCVPTPMAKDGSADLSAIEETAAWLSDLGYCGDVVVRSTVPPRTGDRLAAMYSSMQWSAWPEFLRASSAEHDALNPVRTVFGGDPANEERLVDKQPGVPHLCVSRTCAEFIKHVTNVFHATAVGIANELEAFGRTFGFDWNGIMPNLCDEHIPANIRVSKEGGFGGACLPKDTLALLKDAERIEVPMPVLATIVSENVWRRPMEYSPALESILGGDGEGGE